MTMKETADVIIPLSITPGFLWAVWFVFVIAFSFVSWFLVHHWKYYGIEGNNKIFVKGVYFFGVITLLIFLVIMIGAYSVIK